MKPLGSLAALLAAVRDDAAAEAETIQRDADAAVARTAADETACPPAPADDRHRLAAARDRARAQVAQEDWHDTRDAIAGREQWMAEAIALGTARLREPRPAAEIREELAALAREAIARLPAGAVELVVDDGAVAALDEGWRAALAALRGGAPITIVTAAVNGGCLARTADGRASFDNSYAARAERLQAHWRAALAAIYEQATAAAAVPPAEAS